MAGVACEDPAVRSLSRFVVYFAFAFCLRNCSMLSRSYSVYSTIAGPYSFGVAMSTRPDAVGRAHDVQLVHDGLPSGSPLVQVPPVFRWGSSVPLVYLPSPFSVIPLWRFRCVGPLRRPCTHARKLLVTHSHSLHTRRHVFPLSLGPLPLGYTSQRMQQHSATRSRPQM